MKSRFIIFVALLSLALLSVNTALADPQIGVTLLTSSSISDIYEGQNQTVQFNVTNTGDSNLTSIMLSIPSLGVVNYSLSGALAIGDSAKPSYIIRTNGTTAIGQYSVDIFGKNSSGFVTPSLSTPFTFNVMYPYCSNITGPSNPIYIDSVTNDDKISGKEFKPLDNISIKIRIGNNDDEDSHKVILDVVLVNVKDGSQIDNEAEKKVTVSKDHTQTVTLDMLIPADIDAGTYALYIKAENDDDSDNCVQTSYTLKVKKSTREIIYIPKSDDTANVSCGSSLPVIGNFYNIGNDDEDKIKIEYSDSFGNDQAQEHNNLYSGDKLPLSWSFNIPRNATVGLSNYELTVYYDYNSDDKTYNDEDTFPFEFNVNCQAMATSQTINTEASTAIIGTESQVSVNIANTGAASQTFSTSASADWATIDSITPASVTLAAGEEKEVIIKLDANPSTAIGAKDLVVSVQHNGITETQTVSVNVQQSSAKAGLLDQLSFQLKYNPTWVVIDTALVVAIIVIVILLFAGKKK